MVASLKLKCNNVGWSVKVSKTKTCKALAKRIVITNSGLMKMGRVGMQHNALSAPKRRKRKPSTLPLNSTKFRSVRHLLPNGGLK
jgi:ribosomal protein L35